MKVSFQEKCIAHYFEQNGFPHFAKDKEKVAYVAAQLKVCEYCIIDFFSLLQLVLYSVQLEWLYHNVDMLIARLYLGHWLDTSVTFSWLIRNRLSE